MGKGIGLHLSKWLVFVQNFIFFVCTRYLLSSKPQAAGLAVIGFGAYLLLGGHVPGIELVRSMAIGIVIVGGVVVLKRI